MAQGKQVEGGPALKNGSWRVEHSRAQTIQHRQMESRARCRDGEHREVARASTIPSDRVSSLRGEPIRRDSCLRCSYRRPECLLLSRYSPTRGAKRQRRVLRSRRFPRRTKSIRFDVVERLQSVRLVSDPKRQICSRRTLVSRGTIERKQRDERIWSNSWKRSVSTFDSSS